MKIWKKAVGLLIGTAIFLSGCKSTDNMISESTGNSTTEVTSTTTETTTAENAHPITKIPFLRKKIEEINEADKEMEQQGSQSGEQQRRLHGKAGERGNQNGGAEHGEHVLQAEKHHLRLAERARIVDGIACILGIQPGDIGFCHGTASLVWSHGIVYQNGRDGHRWGRQMWVRFSGLLPIPCVDLAVLLALFIVAPYVAAYSGTPT